MTCAERFIGRHSFTRRLRTLDALQLAVALDLSSQGFLDRYPTAISLATCQTQLGDGRDLRQGFPA